MLAERLLASGQAGRRRHPAAGLHPLPVPGPHHRRRDGPRRRARLLGRRDGVRGAPDPGGDRPRPAHRRARDRTGALSSGDVAWFRELGRRLLGPELEDVEGLAMAIDRDGARVLPAATRARRGVQRLPGAASATTLWLDAGSGTLANLQRHVDIVDVDAVVLSHEHPDHWADLAGFTSPASTTCAAPACRRLRAGLGGRQRSYHAGAAARLARRDRRRPGVEIGGSHRPVLPHRPSARDTGRSRRRRRPDASGTLPTPVPPGRCPQLGAGLDLALCEATFLSDSEGRAQHLSARPGRSVRPRRRTSGISCSPTSGRGSTPTPSRAEASAAFGRDVDVATVGGGVRGTELVPDAPRRPQPGRSPSAHLHP